MSVLLMIIMASVAGGALSVLGAAAVMLNERAQHYLGAMVSYAIGALLGVVFLDILPEAIELTTNVPALSGTVLIGIVGSVVGPLLLLTFLKPPNFNPISPLGFLAAVGGALVSLFAYRLLVGLVLVEKKEDRGQ